MAGDPSVLEVTMELAPKTAKNWTACVMLSGPTHLLPDTPVAPANCTIPKVLYSPNLCPAVQCIDLCYIVLPCSLSAQMEQTFASSFLLS